MKRLAFAVVLVLLAASLASAQGAPTSWNLRIYGNSTGTGTVINVTAAQVTCGQTRPATTSNLNPTKWLWADPANGTLDCTFTDSRLLNMPDGDHEGTITAVNADGSSGETVRVPFVRRRPNPPAVPTLPRFGQ
jgi:hypothetical protein